MREFYKNGKPRETTAERSARISAAWTKKMREEQGERTKEHWERGTFDKAPVGRRKCYPRSCDNAVVVGKPPFAVHRCEVCGKEEWKYEGE